MVEASPGKSLRNNTVTSHAPSEGGQPSDQVTEVGRDRLQPSNPRADKSDKRHS